MTRTLGAILLLAATIFVLGPASGQDVPGGVLNTNSKQFKVPFDLGERAEAVSQLQLYMSSDSGRTWQAVAVATPEQKFFRFRTERDGAYWFAVQQFDKMNRPFPASMENASPNMKVVVDSVPPQISLQPLPSRSSEVGVAWVVRDETFNASQAGAIHLDYRSLNAGATWLPINVPSGATQFYWNPNLQGPMEVRLQAKDQAGNTAEAFTRVSLDGIGNAGFTPPPSNPTTPGYTRNYDPAPMAILNPPAPSDIKLVGSKKIALGYDTKDVGPSRIAAIDLWWTQDGRTWTKHAAFPDAEGKNIVFEVDREGLYGITLVAKSGVGLSDRAPSSGDRPQLWIEADLTKPTVSVRNILVGQGVDKGKIKIAWTAADKNLGKDCIGLKYAEQAEGPWTAIAEKVPNTGEYTWMMPAAVPYQFYIKVEAVDRAGNLGEDRTPNPVKVDLSIPRAIPLNVSPASN